jgi:MFS family permease
LSVDSKADARYAAKVNRRDSDQSMSEVRRPVPLGEAQIEVAAPPLPKITTFTSLRSRDYLRFWLALLAGFTGLQMNIVARGWLVWELTESALKIGVVSFAFGVPILLFSLFGGAIADRMPKRNLLVITQVCHASVTLVIAILVTTDVIQFWHLVAAGAATGCFFVFDGPARQSIIPELVPRRQLLNAISLNSTGMNMTRVVAPTIAGALLVVIGSAGVFYIVAGCYIVAAAALSMISSPQKVDEPGVAPLRAGSSSQSRSGTLARAIWADLVEGLIYLRHSPLIISLLALAFIPLLFGLPYMNLLPVFADEVLGVGEFGFGTLIAMAGVGALAASLGIASLGDYRKKGMLLFVLAIAFGITLILFGLSHSYALSMVVLLGVGAGGAGYMTLNNTMIQSNVPPRMLGRVMSIYMMTFAFMPMGALPIGALGDAIGVGTAVAGGGAIVVFFVLAMAVLRPNLRRLE